MKISSQEYIRKFQVKEEDSSSNERGLWFQQGYKWTFEYLKIRDRHRKNQIELVA